MTDMLSRIALLCALAATTWAQDAATKQVEIYGQKIYYQEAGAGPDVILLHGLGADRSAWAATVPALAAKYHVYVPDQVGFGQSDKPMIDYRVGTLVDFLNAFYKKVGVTKATLVGNLLGGWVAMDFALAHPDKVTRLVLVDSAGYSPKRTGGQPLTRGMLQGLNPSTLAGEKQLMSLVFYHKMFASDQFAEQAFTAHLRKNDGYTIDRFIDSILRGEDVVDGRLVVRRIGRCHDLCSFLELHAALLPLPVQVHISCNAQNPASGAVGCALRLGRFFLWACGWPSAHLQTHSTIATIFVNSN
jgi:pimeloyl-ACP methyl ester carboxylesterase